MFDLAIIGAGPAGFSAALEAKKQGLNVALIENDEVGGTCLNWGCIPTKTLIQSAKILSLSRKSSGFGIETANPRINFAEIQKRKQVIVDRLIKGMEFSLKGVDLMKGRARFVSTDQISVNDKIIKAKSTIIATGSKPMQIPGISFDGKKILSSKDLLTINHIPHCLLIIGGGVIGCEFASLFSILGTDVTIVELMPQLLPQEDKEVAKRLEISFRKRGIKVSTKTDARNVPLDDYELTLLSVGRAPNTEDLDLQRIGIQSEKGRVITNNYMNTSVPNIFAAGDCTGDKLLAHYASHQGAIAVKNIVKPENSQMISSHLIPNCIFTEPEVASVGITEQAAQDKGIESRVSRFDFLGSGMAHIMDETEGSIMIVSDKVNDTILGASIIGPKATELIAILTLAIQTDLKLAKLRSTIFAHPTLSESITEAIQT